MKQERLLQVIQGPYTTEKSSLISGDKQLVFKVDRCASKPEIKKAVEDLMEVRVVAVRIVNVKGKVKRFGSRIGSRSAYKKAYVILDKNTDIDALLSEQA